MITRAAEAFQIRAVVLMQTDGGGLYRSTRTTGDGSLQSV
jgi:hypothetical protein